MDILMTWGRVNYQEILILKWTTGNPLKLTVSYHILYIINFMKTFAENPVAHNLLHTFCRRIVLF